MRDGTLPYPDSPLHADTEGRLAAETSPGLSSSLAVQGNKCYFPPVAITQQPLDKIIIIIVPASLRARRLYEQILIDFTNLFDGFEKDTVIFA